jgi:DNA-binding GntR family transcriptional regulator
VSRRTKNDLAMMKARLGNPKKRPIANMVVHKFRERQRMVAQHERLLDAIRDGKASLAVKVFAEQMSYFRNL